MYVGRIVAVGMNKDGKLAGMYRVSSRSYPNRETRLTDNAVSVMPRAGFEDDLNKSPYIAYNCIRISGTKAVISNGSHTDPTIEKVAMGYPLRDALALTLLAMDYEKDHLDTPRVVGAIDIENNSALLGIVTSKSLHVKSFDMTPGTAYYVATYEHDVPCKHYKDTEFDVSSALDAKEYVFSKGIFKTLEKPVTSAAVFGGKDGFEISAEV